MSYYFRDKPKFGDKLRGKTGDELFQELKQQFDEDKTFEPTSRITRDPFERHSSFSRGFPFDEQGFGRLGDIRSHLDDLAARHPEFAEQLLGPPWGDVPFHGSLNRRRRGSNNSHQSHPDEDARSQASGSSAASAASGASGVSSHGEPEPAIYQQEVPRKIPQYGLRNTVDIGQHRHNMDNPEKESRGQRSMSAPPENRQQEEQQQQPSQGQNPRFISRVDITPQVINNQGNEEKPSKPQQKPQSQSNVRHIPIFVEGRDEPVIRKDVESEPVRMGTQSPSRFYQQPQFDTTPEYHTSPHFHRPSYYSPHFGAGKPRDWSSHFQDPFQSSFDHPPRKTHQSQSSTFKPQQSERQRDHDERDFVPQGRPQQAPQKRQTPQQQQPPQQQQQQPPQQQQQQHSEVPEPPKLKQNVPMDPLERVAMVQKEVDELTEQVKLFTGNSRKDKQYIYLDEMLTRELIKLDDIETEGKDLVRQARKNAIKSIQGSISLLESKAPIPEQNLAEEVQPMDEAQPENEAVNEEKNEGQETAQISDAIPLPASPTKEPDVTENVSVVEAPLAQNFCENPAEKNQSKSEATIEMEENAVEAAPTAMEVQQTPVPECNEVKEDVPAPVEAAPVPVNEVETLPKATKSPKKLKKGKKQPPVSTEAIPLPAAENQAAVN